jgi:predicted nuclease with TOPRIM domain
MNNTDKLKEYIDANVWDGEDRAGCKNDKAVFNPDELQEFAEELIEDCFESEIEAKDKEIERLEDENFERFFEMVKLQNDVFDLEKANAKLTKQRDNAIELIETFSGMPDSSDDLNLLINSVIKALRLKGGSDE